MKTAAVYCPSFPVQDGPISQVRVSSAGLIVNRFNIIGSDHIAIHVHRPYDGAWGTYSTVQSFDRADLPEDFETPYWKTSYDGSQYVSAGWIDGLEPAAALAAIHETFGPQWSFDQTILGAGLQARIENFASCSVEFRTIGRENSCPSCGAWKYRSRNTRCQPCRQWGAPIPA